MKTKHTTERFWINYPVQKGIEEKIDEIIDLNQE
jgi:hypothetical protein